MLTRMCWSNGKINAGSLINWYIKFTRIPRTFQSMSARMANGQQDEESETSRTVSLSYNFCQFTRTNEQTNEMCNAKVPAERFSSPEMRTIGCFLFPSGAYDVRTHHAIILLAIEGLHVMKTTKILDDRSISFCSFPFIICFARCVYQLG